MFALGLTNGTEYTYIDLKIVFTSNLCKWDLIPFAKD